MLNTYQIFLLVLIEIILFWVIFVSIKDKVVIKGRFKWYRNKQPFSYWTSISVAGMYFLILGFILLKNIL